MPETSLKISYKSINIISVKEQVSVALYNLMLCKSSRICSFCYEFRFRYVKRTRIIFITNNRQKNVLASTVQYPTKGCSSLGNDIHDETNQDKIEISNWIICRYKETKIQSISLDAPFAYHQRRRSLGCTCHRCADKATN